MSSRIYVVASDREGNGKTLLARLYADNLLLTGGDPFALDTDSARGGFAAFYPGRSRVVDIARTEGRMALFDTMVAEPDRSFVIDLQARHRDAFFATVAETLFLDEAHRSGREMVVLFVIDRSVYSLHAARQIWEKSLADRLIAVRNRAVGTVLDDTLPAEIRFELPPMGDIVVPELERGLIDSIEALDFSFARFLARKQPRVPEHTAYELDRFLQAVYGQITDLEFEMACASLRRRGIM
jgi:hypothetical protein